MFVLFGRKFFDSADPPQRSASGEPSFIAVIYERYKAFFFQKAALYTDDPYAREDIVQSTILRLMRHEDRLRAMDPAALMTYLALSVRSSALEYLRVERRDSLNALPLPDDGEEGCPLYGGQPTLEEQMLLGRRNEEVRAAIERLSERDKLALMGKYFLGLDSGELAQLLDVTPGTLRTILCRARGRALKELEKEGILSGRDQKNG